MFNKWHIISVLIITSSLCAMDNKQSLIKKVSSQQSLNTNTPLKCCQKINNFFEKPICCNSHKVTMTAYALTTIGGLLSGGIGIATATGSVLSIDSIMWVPVSLGLMIGGGVLASIGLKGATVQGQQPEEDDFLNQSRVQCK